MGLKARILASRFDWAEIGKETINFYNAILENNRA